jgi:sugar phosphate permease
LPEIESNFRYTKATLGLIAAAFSLFYSIGQFVNGHLVDKIGAKKMILAGLALSIIMNSLFSYIRDPFLLMTIWAINGYAQSTGWPSVVKIISNWFKSSIGTIGGIFGTCFLVGNIVTWSLLGYIIANYGWQSAFSIPSLLLILVAAVFYLGVYEKPERNRQVTIESKVSNVKFGFKQILLSKEIIIVSLAYTLLQFIRSGFTLWAPSYLFETWNLKLDLIGYIASIIPLGGIAGSVIFGWLSDRSEKLERRKIMLLLTSFLNFILLIFYYETSYTLQLGAMLLFLFGLALYTPHILMVTLIPLEYKETYSAASVAGFIDGLGYMGTTFADPLIGWMANRQGWNGVMIFLLLTSLIVTLLNFTLVIIKVSSETEKTKISKI